MTNAKGGETIADIIAALKSYNDAVDTSNLDEQDQQALINIKKFWNSPNVYHYEKNLI